MRQLIYIIALIFAMFMGGHGEASATSTEQHESKDKLQKVEPVEQSNDALLSETSMLYRICSTRPERIIPSCNFSSSNPNCKLPQLYKTKFYQNLLSRFRGDERLESAPFHFDAVSRYYVIYLRHLIC